MSGDRRLPTRRRHFHGGPSRRGGERSSRGSL